MTKYIMRLDDACEKRDIKNWNRMELLLDKHGIIPLVGVIPHCEDMMMDKYALDDDFWNLVNRWIQKGWTIAMHGYNHVYSTNCGGINPINKRSEFAGNSLDVQREKIAKGIEILRKHGIEPKVFFAPSHTFDENTLIALKEKSNIRIISDTIAYAPYNKHGFSFIPQQAGMVRKLPLRVVTFCYHPNTMTEKDYNTLELFLKRHSDSFIKIEDLKNINRKKGIVDQFLNFFYFLRK